MIANYEKIQAVAFAMLVAYLPATGSASFAESFVQDRATGFNLSLASREGKTVVTNLTTGESVEVEGEYEGMANEEYTRLLKNKEIEKAAREAAMAVKRLLVEDGPPQKSGYTAARFSVRWSWETPSIYSNTTSATVTVYQDLNPATIYVELFQEIPWWFDDSYGTRTFSSIYETESWSGLEQYANYYLVFTKNNTSNYTTGDWRIDW